MNLRSNSSGSSRSNDGNISAGTITQTFKNALSALILTGASLTSGGEVQESHNGSCSCPGCLPPPRVSVEKQKKEDESGEGI